MIQLSRVLSFSLVLALCAMLNPARGEEKELAVGDEAPKFELPGTDGEIYKLEDFRDQKVVVIAWFPKAFTGGCTAECKSLKANSDAIRKFDVAYFTASCDEPDQNQKFAKSLELDFPILSDPLKDVAKAYGVVHPGREVPERWTFYIGLDGKLMAIDKEVKTATHGEDVAKRLAELMVAEKKSE